MVSSEKGHRADRAPRCLYVGQTFLPVIFIAAGKTAYPECYAVNEVPQPQLPVAFGLVNVKPDPITPVT